MREEKSRSGKVAEWLTRDLLFLVMALTFAGIDVAIVYDQFVAPNIHTPQVSFGVAFWCYYLVAVVISNTAYLVASGLRAIKRIGDYL